MQFSQRFGIKSPEKYRISILGVSCLNIEFSPQVTMFNDNGNDLEVDLPTSPSSESNLVPSDNDDSQRVLEGDVHLPSLPESESEDGGSEVQDPAPKRSKNDAPVRVHTLVGNFKALEKAILSNPKQVQPIPRQLVSEVFSPPRVTAVAQRWAHNDDAIFAFDITYNGWDCLDMHMRAQLKKMIHALRPKLLVLSPPCTMFSALTRTAVPKKSRIYIKNVWS